MTFDLEKARALCNQATFKATGNPINEDLKLLVDQAGMLPAALDRILELESALIEERAKQMCVDEPCPGRTSYEFCELLDDACDGYPSMWHVCPRKKEKLVAAKDDLHSEGKI